MILQQSQVPRQPLCNRSWMGMIWLLSAEAVISYPTMVERHKDAASPMSPWLIKDDVWILTRSRQRRLLHTRVNIYSLPTAPARKKYRQPWPAAVHRLRSGDCWAALRWYIMGTGVLNYHLPYPTIGTEYCGGGIHQFTPIPYCSF